MKPSRVLRNRVAQKRVMAAGITFTQEDTDTPDVFFATSGTSQSELAPYSFMPHWDRPIVGFAPNQ